MSARNKSKSIAIVANATWNIYNFRLNILDKFKAGNYKIYVIAPIDKYIIYKKQYPDVSHIQLSRLKRKSTNPFQDLWLLIEFIRLYRKLKPDIVLHYTVKPNIYGGIAAGILRIPSVAVVTGLGYAFIHPGIIKEITKLLYRVSSYFHDRMVFENEDDLRLFESLKLIRPDQGISIKGCGVDTEDFKPVNHKKNEKLVFTFIGRLLYDKGINEFIEAARRIKKKRSDIVFWLIGEIDKENPAAVREQELVDWIKEKTIVYHGSKENIKDYISASDCIVLPSYREGLPKILLESMSMGKPVITTDSPGCREAVEDGYNGFLVPIKDIDSLENAIIRMMEMKESGRLAMGKNGRTKAKSEFESGLIADQMFKIMDAIF